MLKDIPELIVKDIALAVVPPQSSKLMNDPEVQWKVYLINLKQEPIKSILVSSKGYGDLEGEQVSTSILRHFIEELGPNSYTVVEPIDRSVFNLHNEYWVSFYINQTIYDKKYLFVPGSLLAENFLNIPVLNMPGVMIK